MNLPKRALLPLPRATVDQISLGNHLALAACSGSGGSAHLFNELVRALYLTFYIGEMGYAAGTVELYRAAESGLEHSITRGNEDGTWVLEASARQLLEEVLRIHDNQLGSARAGDFMMAEQKLSQFIHSDRKASPFD
ncbi:hypothetical protein [Paraburkholderia sp. SIMBA_054]|uniref:hypothetical protein n=1 Tax=Paraburkholderia sp. SIMBA_054 TaxID=3085795 RepID=UPI0039793223